jgi:small-conductance mechanosensitive channel
MVGEVIGIGNLLTDQPACINQPDTWCYTVYQFTHNTWLAASANWLLAKPLKILLIALFAFGFRLVVHRLIDRLTRDRGKVPALLRPLRERAPHALAPLISERRAQRARTIGSVLKSITSLVVWGIAVVWMLGELGFNLTPIIASAGVVGVAVGFGAQNLVRDFLSGVFMLLEDQYGVGDVVDTGSATGTVESVGLRITTLRDSSGTVWYVRNGEIKRVGNSSQGFAVAVVDLPVGYGSDVELALDVLQRAAAEATTEAPLADDVMEEPTVLGVQSVADDRIMLRLTVKVRPGRQWAAQRELRRRLMPALAHAGIEPHFVATEAPQDAATEPATNVAGDAE